MADDEGKKGRVVEIIELDSSRPTWDRQRRSLPSHDEIVSKLKAQQKALSEIDGSEEEADNVHVNKETGEIGGRGGLEPTRSVSVFFFLFLQNNSTTRTMTD